MTATSIKNVLDTIFFAANTAIAIVNHYQQFFQFFVCHAEPPKSSLKISS